jgi:hypothetical protein
MHQVASIERQLSIAVAAFWCHGSGLELFNAAMG